MTSSRDVALGTPELLERILLEVDMRTLLTSAQRVSKYWNSLVTTSPAIQHHLFLRPQPPRVGKTRVKNPLFAEIFPNWFQPCAVMQKSKGHVKPYLFRSHFVESYRFARSTVLNAAFRREDATWRRMLPCQPPMESFIRVRYTSNELGKHAHFYSVWRDKAPELTSVEDHLSRLAPGVEPRPEPMTMDMLYHILAMNSGVSHSWLFIWDDGDGGKDSPTVEIPEDLQPHRISGSISPETSQELTKALRRDGLVMLEFRTIIESGLTPWKFEHNLVFHEVNRSW